MITAYANADTESILFDFNEPLQVEISGNQATVTATSPGIYRGEVCAITDDVSNCESIVVEMTVVEEEEAVPKSDSEAEERSTYVSQLTENIITIVVMSIILFLVTLLGWKRPKAPAKWSPQVNHDNSVPAAPDLSMWNN